MYFSFSHASASLLLPGERGHSSDLCHQIGEGICSGPAPPRRGRHWSHQSGNWIYVHVFPCKYWSGMYVCMYIQILGILCMYVYGMYIYVSILCSLTPLSICCVLIWFRIVSFRMALPLCILPPRKVMSLLYSSSSTEELILKPTIMYATFINIWTLFSYMCEFISMSGYLFFFLRFLYDSIVYHVDM
jgi:hypothetical protein